jgi:hypothetical protein
LKVISLVFVIISLQLTADHRPPTVIRLLSAVCGQIAKN